MPYTYDYPRPMLTTDILLFSGEGDERMILLVNRGRPPFEGYWALPGGFVEMDEDLIDGARRELFEETGISGVALQELFTIGTPGRDPRGRVVTVLYYGIVQSPELNPVAGDDAAALGWFFLSELPELAFDHKDIVIKALQRIFGEK